MGTILETKYTPEPLDGIEFHYLPGQTMKLIGLSYSPIACHAINVNSKCVISAQQEIAEMFVVTALVNN